MDEYELEALTLALIDEAVREREGDSDEEYSY